MSYGREAVEEVYRKATEFDYGTTIDATLTLAAIVEEITSSLRLV